LDKCESVINQVYAPAVVPPQTVDSSTDTTTSSLSSSEDQARSENNEAGFLSQDLGGYTTTLEQKLGAGAEQQELAFPGTPEQGVTGNVSVDPAKVPSPAPTPYPSPFMTAAEKAAVASVQPVVAPTVVNAGLIPVVKPLPVTSDSDKPPSIATVKKRNAEREVREVEAARHSPAAMARHGAGSQRLVVGADGFVQVHCKEKTPQPGQAVCECGNPSNKQCRGCNKHRCASCLGKNKKNCSSNVQCSARDKPSKTGAAKRGKRNRSGVSSSNSSNDDEASSSDETDGGDDDVPVLAPPCSSCNLLMHLPEHIAKCNGGCGRSFHRECLTSDGSKKARVCMDCNAKRTMAKVASKQHDSDYKVGQMMTSDALARCQGAITDALLEATSDLYDKTSGAPVVPHLCILEQEYVSDGTYRDQLVPWLEPSTGARENRRVKDLPLGTTLVTVINVSNSHWAVVKWAHVEADKDRAIVAFDSLGAALSSGVQRWVNGLSKTSLVVDECVKMAQFPTVPDSCGPCSVNLVMTLARKGDVLNRVWFAPEVCSDRLQFKSWVQHYFGLRRMSLECLCCDGPLDKANSLAVECSECHAMAHRFCVQTKGRRHVCQRCSSKMPIQVQSQADPVPDDPAGWQRFHDENTQNPALELEFLAAEKGNSMNTKGLLRGMMEYVCSLQGRGKHELGFFMPSKLAIKSQRDLLLNCGQDLVTYGHIPVSDRGPAHFRPAF
jgi:hypothetical protein